MDNKDDKQMKDQKEKRKFKLNKAKMTEFFKRNGFYIALFICIAAAGLTAILSLTGTDQSNPKQSAAAVSDGKQVEQVQDPSLQEEILKRNTSSSPSPSVSASAIPSPSPSVSAKQSSASAFTLQAPVKGKIIKTFMIDKLTYNKTLNQWATHNGIDIQASEGDTVKAAMAGTVDQAYDDQIYGGIVIVKQDDGKQTVYAGVKADDKVKQGAKITLGQTLGVVKTPNFEAYLGPHLHFELLDGTNYLDPTKYFG